MLRALVVTLAFATPCQEDMACWNWRTMGNGTRGLVTLAGRHKVVDGHHFNELTRVRRIDWARSARMLGDKPSSPAVHTHTTTEGTHRNVR